MLLNKGEHLPDAVRIGLMENVLFAEIRRFRHILTEEQERF